MPLLTGLASQNDENVPAVMTPASARQPDRSKSQQVRIKNRRKRYLDLHPEYFSSSELEVTEPLLYDRFVRSFQLPAEREQKARERGSARPTTITGDILETNLTRSEAKMEAVRHPDPNSPVVYRRAQNGTIVSFEQDEDDRAQSKEDGWARWTDIMGQRFLQGGDRHFEYEMVDHSEDYDDRAEEDRERLEEWLNADEDGDGDDARPDENSLRGQTGIQDF